MNPYLLINIKQRYSLTAPTDEISAFALIVDLSRRSQIICALEAAKIIYPVWENYIRWGKYTHKNKPLTKTEKEAPLKIINTIEKLIAGKATKDEVKKANSYTCSAYRLSIDCHNDKAAYHAYMAIKDAASAASADNKPTIVTTTAHAINTVILAGLHLKWWDRCYPLIDKELQELQDKYNNIYDNLCKEISGDI